MLLYGALLGCIAPVITIAAAMSLARSPFLSPHEQRQQALMRQAEMRQREQQAALCAHSQKLRALPTASALTGARRWKGVPLFALGVGCGAGFAAQAHRTRSTQVLREFRAILDNGNTVEPAAVAEPQRVLTEVPNKTTPQLRTEPSTTIIFFFFFFSPQPRLFLWRKIENWVCVRGVP